jgi:hypothetical protein
MTFPVIPVPNANTAGFIDPVTLTTYQDFYSIPYPWRGLDTQIVHIAPNGNVTHLNGPGAGQEGVVLSMQLQGEQHLPFDQVIMESAFQMGSTITRTNYPQRLINLRIQIGGTINGFQYNTYSYQLADNRWWSGQDETQDGWLGIYTRFTGWRWIPVRPFKTVDTAQKMAPEAFQNNQAIWDINWVSERPYYTRTSLFKTWSAGAGLTKRAKDGMFSGSLILANQADMPSYVQYIVNGAGNAEVQDNNSSTMVKLPILFASDGPALVDTDPQERTLTASNDPIDNIFYEFLRSSTILNFLLSNVAAQGEPWWERGYVRFLNAIPPQTVATLNVAHSNPNATITAVVQQRYKRSR